MPAHGTEDHSILLSDEEASADPRPGRHSGDERCCDLPQPPAHAVHHKGELMS